MPNRIIKESICYSADLDQLTPFEETVFYRLIVNCDDYGRFDARPEFVKSKLFVTKRGITDKNIADALSKLASLGLVRLYRVDEKPFLVFPKWDKHQRIRNSKEKWPSPVDFDISPQVAASCGLNPIQSESNPNPNPNARAALFEEFWSTYPKKVGKGAAEKAWTKIKPDKALCNIMLSAIERQKTSAQWKKENGQYIPNPATWLNQCRWEDELEGKVNGNDPRWDAGTTV